MTGPEKEALAALEPALGGELAKAVVEFRRHTKKAPLTGYAAKLLLKEYEKTGDPRAAADMQISMSWQGFKSSWYFNELQKQERQQRGSGRRTVVDAASDLINGSGHSGYAFGLPQLQRH